MKPSEGWSVEAYTFVDFKCMHEIDNVMIWFIESYCMAQTYMGKIAIEWESKSRANIMSWTLFI